MPNPGTLLPLSVPVFHILVSLSEAEAHGYGIIQAVVRLTDGEVSLSTSTLYGAIKRMLRDQLIEESEMRPAPDLDDQRRKYYRISDFGRQVADLEAKRIHRVSRLLQTTRFLPDEPAR